MSDEMEMQFSACELLNVLKDDARKLAFFEILGASRVFKAKA